MPIHFPLKPSKVEEERFLEYLEGIYTKFDSASAYASPQTVLNKIKRDGLYTNIGINRVRRYMGVFSGYTINKQRNAPAKRTRRYTIQRVNHNLEMDLMDMSRYSEYNNDIKYILVVIDTFSRRGYVEPLLDKKSDSVVSALEIILDDRIGHKISVLNSDLGKEFTGKAMRTFLAMRGIRQTFAKQSTHAQICERFIRSIRNLIRAYMVQHNTHRFIDRLQDLINVYNNRKHSSIGMSPNSMTEYTGGFGSDYESLKWKERTRPRSFKFKIGDKVRIATVRSIFDKHTYNYSTEEFTVHKRSIKDNVNVYELRDCANDDLEGLFYEHELVKILVKPNQAYTINKLIKEEKRNGVKYVYVSFKGFPNPKCNQWIPKADLLDE